MVGERKLGSNCVCQSKCMDAIGEEECAKIVSSFWALGTLRAKCIPSWFDRRVE
jgi:hypothetical protein